LTRLTPEEESALAALRAYLRHVSAPNRRKLERAGWAWIRSEHKKEDAAKAILAGIRGEVA